jgi:protein-S-isoprenylcysteine O-methyltransferase Ste14
MTAARSAIESHRINILRAGAALLFIPIFFVTSAWEQYPIVHETLEATGALLIIAGVLGRFWSILYAGGRKNELVLQDGPYSICRHPLYLFSTIAVLGFGLFLGSFIVAFALSGFVFAVLRMTAASEERFLIGKFGQSYSDYAARTPAIIPRLSQFSTPQHVTFDTGHLRINFRDALVFLSLLPLGEAIEYLHESALLPSIPLW